MRRLMAMVVGKLIGRGPRDMPDYGMSPLRGVRQWVADALRSPPVFPVHGWSLGYGGPREPFTWFACEHGHLRLGSSHRLPPHPCWRAECLHGPTRWRPADLLEAATATAEALAPLPACRANADAGVGTLDALEAALRRLAIDRAVRPGK